MQFLEAARSHVKVIWTPKLCQSENYSVFSKLEALLYYLAVMGQVNRDEIAGILWGDKKPSSSQNLRNTVYQANKILKEIFTSHQAWPLILTLNSSLLSISAPLKEIQA